VLIFHSGFASGRKLDRVPWKQIKEHTSSFIEPRYLPELIYGAAVPQLEDPSDMKKEQIASLLEHWRRPVHASELFRFRKVLVNNKSEETMGALYSNSFAALISLPVPPDDDWVDNDLPLIDTHHPTSDAFTGIPTPIPTYPTLDPNIDPDLQFPNFHFPTPAIGLTTLDSSPAIPTLNPTPVDEFIPSGASTPGPSKILSPVGSTLAPERTQPPRPRPQPKNKMVSSHPTTLLEVPTSAIGLTTLDSSPTILTLNPTPVDELLVSIPSGTPTPGPSEILSPVGSTLAPEHTQAPPRPRPQPKNKIDSSHPTTLLEENLGRPKRNPKRKIDLYLEAEEKNELAKQKRKK
jgi:hypothetical protein